MKIINKIFFLLSIVFIGNNSSAAEPGNTAISEMNQDARTQLLCLCAKNVFAERKEETRKYFASAGLQSSESEKSCFSAQVEQCPYGKTWVEGFANLYSCDQALRDQQVKIFFRSSKPIDGADKIAFYAGEKLLHVRQLEKPYLCTAIETKDVALARNFIDQFHELKIYDVAMSNYPGQEYLTIFDYWLSKHPLTEGGIRILGATLLGCCKMIIYNQEISAMWDLLHPTLDFFLQKCIGAKAEINLDHFKCMWGRDYYEPKDTDTAVLIDKLPGIDKVRETLLEIGIPDNDNGKNGYSALLLQLARYGYLDAVKKFIAKKWPIEGRNYSLLLEACSYSRNDSNYRIIEYFIEKMGGSIKSHLDGRTPLHCALNKDDNSLVVELLIRAGADPNECGKYGITPLDRAYEKKYQKSIEVLRANGGYTSTQLMLRRMTIIGGILCVGGIIFHILRTSEQVS
jgi:hypothetical protein